MNLITKETDNAVRAIIEIARSQDNFLSTSELEKLLQLPRPFLRKVMQQLAKANILNSMRGNKGGFKLLKKPENIYLFDIINIFQGKITIAECLFRKKICPNRSSCVIRRRIKKIELKMIEEINSVSIKNLIDDLTN